jgi:secondary thiamine-phosphate synthase enzyme
MLRQHQRHLSICTLGRNLVDVTKAVLYEVRASQINEGLMTMFIRHTSASLVIQENADPDVRNDLERFFARLVRDGDPLFLHRSEGPDDMPAHVRAALTAMQISVRVSGGELMLGTWQGIYLWEHRTRAH